MIMACQLYIHRNTLVYRLQRIRALLQLDSGRCCGSDISCVLVVFCWNIIRKTFKLENSNTGLLHKSNSPVLLGLEIYFD